MDCQILNTAMAIAQTLDDTFAHLTAGRISECDIRQQCVEVLEENFLALCPEPCIERRVDAFLSGRFGTGYAD